MKIKTYKINTVLEVEWIDIVEDSSWIPNSIAGSRPDADCKSIGYYFKKDSEFLYLSTSIPDDARSRIAIPIGAIKKVKKL